MDKRDKDGWRLGPDGKTFVIPFTQMTVVADIVKAAELVAEYWKALGLKVTMKTVSYGLWDQMRAANELKAGILDSALPLWREGIYEISAFARTAPLWHLWSTTDGKEGEEPPEEIKRLIELTSERAKEVLPGTPESKKIWDEVWSILFHDYLVVIPLSENNKVPALYSAKLNFSDIDTGFEMLGEYAAEQMFFRQ